jgi:acyl-coenzyme A synthetase/AMP-(fatty) acid ligase
VRGPDGQLSFVGRADDVFKSSDDRVSPFEIESALIEHEAVAEAAVVPSSAAPGCAKGVYLARPWVLARPHNGIRHLFAYEWSARTL